MRMLLTLTLLLPLSTATPGAATADARAAFDETMAVGDQYFDASVSGMRAYVDTLAHVHPTLRAALVDGVEHLEGEQRRARRVAGVSLAASTLLIGGALATGWQGWKRPQYAAAFTGLGVATVGCAVAAMLQPDRSELLELLNRHNRLNPRRPARLSIRVRPSDAAVTVSIGGSL